jgi:hypothetical protein
MPAPVVSGGILYQGQTTISGYQAWGRSDFAADFSTTPGYTLTLNMKVISSSYAPSPWSDARWRAGYATWVVDKNGTYVGLGIASTGVRFILDPEWSGLTDFIPYDTTTSFHTYGLKIQPDHVSLLIDGRLMSIVPRRFASGGNSSSYVTFGDETYKCQSQVQLRSVTLADYTSPPLVGDANYDGTVNSMDFDVLVSNYGTLAQATWAMGDFDADEKVTSTDFNLLAGNFGESTSAALGVNVPEPSLLSLLIALLMTSVWTETKRAHYNSRNCKSL